MFLNRYGNAMTRFGIHYACGAFMRKLLTEKIPSLKAKRISPHTDSSHDLPQLTCFALVLISTRSGRGWNLFHSIQQISMPKQTLLLRQRLWPLLRSRRRALAEPQRNGAGNPKPNGVLAQALRPYLGNEIPLGLFMEGRRGSRPYSWTFPCTALGAPGDTKPGNVER